MIVTSSSVITLAIVASIVLSGPQQQHTQSDGGAQKMISNTTKGVQSCQQLLSGISITAAAAIDDINPFPSSAVVDVHLSSSAVCF
jgi:hypothetical protein